MGKTAKLHLHKWIPADYNKINAHWLHVKGGTYAYPSICRQILSRPLPYRHASPGKLGRIGARDARTQPGFWRQAAVYRVTPAFSHGRRLRLSQRTYNGDLASLPQA